MQNQFAVKCSLFENQPRFDDSMRIPLRLTPPPRERHEIFGAARPMQHFATPPRALLHPRNWIRRELERFIRAGEKSGDRAHLLLERPRQPRGVSGPRRREEGRGIHLPRASAASAYRPRRRELNSGWLPTNFRVIPILFMFGRRRRGCEKI